MNEVVLKSKHYWARISDSQFGCRLRVIYKGLPTFTHNYSTIFDARCVLADFDDYWEQVK